MSVDKPTGQPGPLQPGEFTSASTPNTVSFKTNHVDPPSSLYIQRDDQLLFVANSQSTPVLTLTARLWLATEGRITTIQQTINLTAKDTTKFVQIPLAEGYLLSVTVVATAATLQGQTYALVWINRGPASPAPTVPGAVLISDYVTGEAGASWPGGRVNKPGDGPGAPIFTGPGNPAAGADWSLSPGSFEMWEVVSLVATLTTSATAGNRNIQIQMFNSANQTFASVANAAVPPSTVATFCASQINQTSTLITTTVFAVLPPRHLLFNIDKIQTVTQNLAAGDQWSNITLLVREWQVL